MLLVGVKSVFRGTLSPLISINIKLYNPKGLSNLSTAQKLQKQERNQRAQYNEKNCLLDINGIVSILEFRNFDILFNLKKKKSYVS